MIKFLKCFLLCSMTIITGCGKETMIQSDLSSLAEEIMQFYDKTGTYPESLDDLDIDIPRDRLGTGPYKYINWDNEIVRVYSVGWDGRDDQSFKDMVYKIKDSRPVFELMQIATTKDDPDNGIALFMQAGKLFVEQISTPSQNANRSKFSPDPVAEFWMSIADKVQFVIVHGWDQAALQEKRPKLTSNFSDLDETFTKLKDVFDLFHQGANKDYSKPYSLPPRLDNPNPSFLTYLILGKLMIAQGKRFEADGKQDIACENYVAVLKLAQALDHGMLLGKTIENALGMMAHDALHKNTGSKPAELIPQIESMVASAHRLSDCLEQEMEAALIAYGDIRTNPNPDQTDQFFIQHWTRIVKYIKERYEKNSARLKQPYPEFKEYVPDYNQLDKTMIAIMNMVDIGFPSLLNAHTRDSLKKSYAHATILKAALDAYKMQQGRYPAHLDELVPEILESPPTDPLANDSYRYDGSVLYSVGPDLVDNYATVIYESTNGIVSSGDIVFGQSRK